MGIWQTRPEIGQDELPRTVFDAVDTGLIVVDGDHRVIACNAWFTSAARIGAEEAIGRTIEELFPQTGTGRLTSAVAEALKYGTSSILTHSLHPALLPLKTRAGRVLIHDVTVGPGGRAPAVHCPIQIFNVTVAAERDRVLRERQNARFDAVVDSAPDVILTLDDEDKIQLANPAAARQFGYTSQELIGQPATKLFEDHAAWNEIRSAVMSGNVAGQPIELIALHKDGSPSFFEVSLSRWVSESRQFVTAILRDVTERRAAEEVLRASEEQFRSMAQAVPNHVWTASPNGLLDWFNDRVYEYSGTKPGTLDGQGWNTLVHPDDLPIVIERWAESSGIRAPIRSAVPAAPGRWHIPLAHR